MEFIFWLIAQVTSVPTATPKPVVATWATCREGTTIAVQGSATCQNCVCECPCKVPWTQENTSLIPNGLTVGCPPPMICTMPGTVASGTPVPTSSPTATPTACPTIPVPLPCPTCPPPVVCPTPNTCATEKDQIAKLQESLQTCQFNLNDVSLHPDCTQLESEFVQCRRLLNTSNDYIGQITNELNTLKNTPLPVCGTTSCGSAVPGYGIGSKYSRDVCNEFVRVRKVAQDRLTLINKLKAKCGKSCVNVK